MTRLAPLSVLAALLCLTATAAQEPKPAPPTADPAKRPRDVYRVRHADPDALAEVVGAHFKGEATVLAAPGGALLVSGSATGEVLALLARLDVKPRTVEVEVTIAEVPAKDWKDGEASADALLAAAAGKGAPAQRVKLTAVEGQPVSAQSGGSKPLIDGGRAAPGGGFGGKGAPPAPRSISYHQVGTTVKATARVGTDDAVAVELVLQDSRVRVADAGDEVTAATIENNSLSTRVSVPAGKAVVAQAVRTEGKAGATVAAVVVTARVVPDAPPPKGR